MKYVLDTNVVREVMLATPAVLSRLSTLRSLDIGLPQPVIAEIAAGIARLPKSRRKALLLNAFERVKRELPRCAWSDDVSEHFGEVKALLESRGAVIEDFDVAIAAHALAEQATLVTPNTRHFERVPGLLLEDWSQ